MWADDAGPVVTASGASRPRNASRITIACLRVSLRCCKKESKSSVLCRLSVRVFLFLSFVVVLLLFVLIMSHMAWVFLCVIRSFFVNTET